MVRVVVLVKYIQSIYIVEYIQRIYYGNAMYDYAVAGVIFVIYLFPEPCDVYSIYSIC